VGGEGLVQWKEGRKKYCFDCWWCNIDHLQFLCFNLLLRVFQIKTYTDDDWFLICLFPLLSELFYLGLHAADITTLGLNLRFGLEPKYLTSYPNCVHSFWKLCISHSLLTSTFLCFLFPTLLPDNSFFLGYYLSFLRCSHFFHLAVLSGWSSEILDNCQGFLDIWQSIWNRMGNFIRVSAHMQMMRPAHAEAIVQNPGALACRVCATQVVSRWMAIPACLRKSESRRVCWVADRQWCRCVPACGADFMHSCDAACPRHDGQPDFFLSFNFWASQSSVFYSVPPPLSVWGNRNLRVHASFWDSLNRTKLTDLGRVRAQGLRSQLFKPGERCGVEWHLG